MKSFFEQLSESAQKEYWASLALRSCENCTPRLLRNLLRAYGSAYEIFCIATQNKGSLENFPKEKRALPIPLKQELRSDKWREKAMPEWQMSKKSYGEIILWTDYRYPLGLKQIVDAPPFFYARGDLSLLASPSVAIVGSRKFHPLSLEKAKSIAKDLSAAGICVVSGLAKGIDTAAHQGALSELGKTIAVLGSGIDVVYPKENLKLHEQIAKQGLVISEFPPFSKPDSKNFPIRNRLVSALSEGVLVVEAAPKSGSLITARLALEQNRNVYVIRPLDDIHSLGCHSLIQDGAVEVEDALSIITDIAPQLEEKFFSVDPKSTDSNEVIPVKKSAPPNTISVTCNRESVLKNNTKIKQHSMIHAEFSLNTSPQKVEITKKKGFLENKATDSKISETPKIKSHVTSLPFEQNNQHKDIQSVEITSFKRRPSFHEDVPSLAIDFGDFAKTLMGKRQDFSVQDVLVSKKKSPKKTDKKSNGKPQESFPKETNPNGYDIWRKNETSSTAKSTDETKATPAPKELDVSELSPFEQNIIQILHKETNLAPDEILTRLPKESQDISELSMTLLMLEVEGKVQRLSGNRYILA